MTNPLVATKFFVPKPRDGALPRHRISEWLDRGANGKLTLLSAPAGFGKTAALAAWLATHDGDKRHVAWLSLDEADNDALSFWTHVIAAVQHALPMGFQQVSRPGDQPIGVFLTALLNALAGFEGILDLVLDDFHVVNQPDILKGVVFLLDHLPPHIHIIISTRADPALPLARFRARGELMEIRATDLRFTAEEVATYLNDSLGLGLTDRDVAALEHRTEGWVAALQLAGLSMQGRSDAASFVASFAGDDRYVFDYLVEEVLERQSDEVRSFLLATCFLDRLGGPLCDAVTGRSGSKSTLDALYRANLLLVPLDDRREWYRYHHLFADVLLTQLDDVGRGDVPALRRRASDWYEQHGERPEAIRQALAGGAVERAAELIELAIPEAQKNRREALIRGWLSALPDDLVRTRPVLGIGFVGALATSGELGEVEDRLLDIERCLAVRADEGPSAEDKPLHPVVVDKAQLPRLPGSIELYRAALAQVRGDVSATIRHARRVLELAPIDDHLSRASGSSILGIGYWSQGKLDEALQAWTEGWKGLQRIGHLSDTLGISIALADINLALGRLRAAMQVYEQALQLAATQNGSILRGTADMHAGLSELCREQNELQAAHRHILESQKLGEGAGLPQHPYRWRVAMAHLLRDEGDFDGAASLLDEAERVFIGDFFPNIRPVPAIKARAYIAQGRLDDALRWQGGAGIGVDDELSYLREFEHITLARLLLAQLNDDDSAAVDRLSSLLERLTKAAGDGGRNGSAIELSILQALVHRRGDIGAALVHLQRAVALAEPEGYVRLFVNEGPPMQALLKLALKRGIAPAYLRKLHAAFSPREALPQKHPDLIEPLSERELDVLRLLRSELGGTEIARELMVSPNTMRTHTKNIYDKLGVNSRRSAVRRAEELGLLGRTKSL